MKIKVAEGQRVPAFLRGKVQFQYSQLLKGFMFHFNSTTNKLVYEFKYSNEN